jgi:hypothetical protein
VKSNLHISCFLFIIFCRIGEGGAATVHKGTWNNEFVALKLLTIRESSDDNNNLKIEEEDSFSKVFNEFRREVFIMR